MSWMRSEFYVQHLLLCVEWSFLGVAMSLFPIHTARRPLRFSISLKRLIVLMIHTPSPSSVATQMKFKRSLASILDEALAKSNCGKRKINASGSGEFSFI